MARRRMLEAGICASIDAEGPAKMDDCSTKYAVSGERAAQSRGGSRDFRFFLRCMEYSVGDQKSGCWRGTYNDVADGERQNVMGVFGKGYELGQRRTRGGRV